jgi:hypothetical protein
MKLSTAVIICLAGGLLGYFVLSVIVDWVLKQLEAPFDMLILWGRVGGLLGFVAFFAFFWWNTHHLRHPPEDDSGADSPL